MRVSAVLLLAVMPLALACEDETDGTYELVSIGDDRLPVVEEGLAVTGGTVEVREDSLIHTRTIVFGYRTHSPDQHEIRNATAYEVDGNLIRALPEIVAIPDDFFEQCAEGGVYRVEDMGNTLLMIDVVRVGECRTAVDPERPIYVFHKR